MPLKKKPNGLEDGEDDSAKLWFANQLSDDACASMATLNVLLNVKEVELEERLRKFRDETERMSSPVCRLPICSFLTYLKFAAVDEGLSVSNADFIRQAHNALAWSVLPIAISICPLS